MKTHKIAASEKPWSRYTKSEKRVVYLVWGTIGAVILLWITSGFTRAVAIVLLAYLVYYVVKAVRASKSKRRNPVIIAAVLFAAIGIMAPQQSQGIVGANTSSGVQQASSADAKKAELERVRQLEAAKPQVRSESKIETVGYGSIDTSDGSLPLGERKESVAGINGERTITYNVTYINGLETERKEVKAEITKQPVQQVTLVGTYVKPATSSGDGYTNSQGNHVASPSTNPSGATAQCGDGTYSYSQSRRGTCSHHGGVATWL